MPPAITHLVSLVQTAEGALNETHDILQRMRELSVQSANDSNTEQDRAELQKETDQLAEALNDISDDTEFNEQKLLDGNFEATFQVGANKDQNLDIQVGQMNADSLGVAGELEETTVAKLEDGLEIDGEEVDEDTNVLTKGDHAVAVEAGQDDDEGFYALDDVEYDGDDISVKSGAEKMPTLEKGSAPDNFKIDGEKFTDDVLKSGDKVVAAEIDDGDFVALDDVKYEEGKDDEDGTFVADDSATTMNEGDAVPVDGGIDISSQGAANDAVETIQGAIDDVSGQRSKLGAVQNRLDHTINNLGTSSENLTAAESRIRDVDYDVTAA